MRSSPSVLEALLQALPDLRPQMYFKSSLTALSHAMEDQVLAGSEQPLIIASFQRERFYRQEAHRYQRIADITDQVYVLAAPETDFANRSEHYETVAFDLKDALAQEWHLVVVGPQYTACLVCRERKGTAADPEPSERVAMDQVRRFDGIWTFDRRVSHQAASLLLTRIERYRPELKAKIAAARAQYLSGELPQSREVDPDPFAQRLVTYLQAGQYKLLKAYRSISAQERRERLVNSITAAIRRSLDPEEIFKIAVQEMGQALEVCRCLVYRCKNTDDATPIQHEFLNQAVESLKGQTWPLQNNPLFQAVLESHEPIAIENTQAAQSTHFDLTAVQDLVDRWHIRSWLMVPILYKGRLLGMVELHHCQALPYSWNKDEVALVEAIATQLGVALIQAESYANLEELNQQLEALERTRSNLIAITGHELRTPLSTIQVCLESLATEPDMSLELRQVMLNSALADAERMRKLVQDFLTLSRLESGRIEWNLEPLSLRECVDLSLSSIQSRYSDNETPAIKVQVSENLPLIRADGEWLVEVLSKLIDNACKFTGPEGCITIKAKRNGGQMLEITVADTGRGIEPQRLDVVFDRFYQEEGALRRTTGGTGLGLAICRQIVLGLGGEIWAESPGRDRGSQFHFTIPIIEDSNASKPSRAQQSRAKSRPGRAAYRRKSSVSDR